MIVISFEDEALHESCVNLERTEQLLGSVHAEALTALISDAEAFENAGQLIDFLGDEAKVTPQDTLVVAVGSDYLVVLTATGKRFDFDAYDRINWATVTRLKLVEISRLP